jgi:antitoxin component of RelBE/YafQ-DinJ toxin-antitoxin module
MKMELVDKMLLLKAIVEGSVPIELVEPNQSALNAQARSLKSGFSVPGCKLIEEPDKT